MHYLNMALIDKASLLFVPSVVAQEKAFNILPSGNRAPDSTDQNSGYDQTRADFTFDRGSNAAATRVNSDGLIEKYRENLSLYSNTFSSWNAASGGSVTSGQSGYDGTNDAWLLTSGAFTYSRIERNINYTGVYTISLYAKAGTLNWLSLENSGITSDETYFDLVNGTTGTDGSNVIQSNIESVGDGWYRCSATLNGTSNVQRIYPAVGNGDLNSAEGNIYIQNFQLETGLVATDVLTSGATTAKAGVLIDLPRINYDANGENGSLLLEPSRQQLLQYSEFFNTYYTIQAISTTANAVVSPEGLQNASKLIPNSGTGGNRSLGKSFAGLSGIHTFSTFAKAGEYGYVSLRLRNSPSAFVMFDLNDGSIHNINTNAQYVTNSAKIEDYGNGWYRCSVSFDPSGSDTAGELYPSLSVGITGDETTSFDGDGTSGIYIYGMQFEQGSYATSYIPNHGESGGVTRAADSCTGGGSAESINSTEGVAFVECSFLADDVGENRDFYISDGTATNRIRIRFTSSDVVNFLVYNGSVQADINYTLQNPTNNNKIAVKWKANDFALWVNGTERGTDTSGTTFSTNTLDDVSFFTTYNQSQIFHSNVKQVAVFNEALSDSELATLTTL